MLTIAQRAGASAPISGPATYLQDNFADAAPTNITTRPMTVGGNWTAATGPWLASAGLAHDSAVAGADNVSGNALHSDATITQAITLGTDAGLLLRGVDTLNYLLLRVQANALTLFTIIGGGATQVATHVVAWAAGQTHTVKVVLLGNALTISLDGVLVATDATAQFQTATRFGLWANTDNTSTFGPFLVTA